MKAVSIQFDGKNAQAVSQFLKREAWVKCSGDLAVNVMPVRLCDNAHIETVPLGAWVASTKTGIEIHDEKF